MFVSCLVLYKLTSSCSCFENGLYDRRVGKSVLFVCWEIIHCFKENKNVNMNKTSNLED